MIYIETCSFKINLNLRVLRKRDDGYHEIHTLFWKRRSPEILEISPGVARECLRVTGARIPGENLLTRACAFLRASFGDEALPPLGMKLSKCLPMGGGIGSGSGNAAALLRWFERFSGLPLPKPSEIGKLGADVAFLAGCRDLALADGIGENLRWLDDSLDLPGVVLFPKWSSSTKEAYAALDRIRAEAPKRKRFTAAEARFESLSILKHLGERKYLGLLPNDFFVCNIEQRSCYNKAYTAFEKSGALAWGLCGSGASCFALYRSRGELKAAISSQLLNFSWLQKMMAME